MKNKFLKVEVKIIDDVFYVHQETDMDELDLEGAYRMLIKEASIKNKKEVKLENKIESSNGELLLDWANKLHEEKKMSNRLHRLLTHPQYFPNRTLKDIYKDYFLRYRGCGLKNWDEFVTLRGY